MYKRFTDGYFALGLMVGGGIMTILFLFGQSIYDLAKCNHDGHCDRYAAQYEGKDFPSSWWWLWDGGLVSAKDSLAQWIMALFTIAVALLVWRTLVATQLMVVETRRIGQAQVRAHLHLEPIDVIIKAVEVDGVDCVHAYVKGKIHNTGGSPAYRVKTMFEFKQAKKGEIVAVNISGKDLGCIQHTMASIPSNGSSFVELERTFPTDLESLKHGTSSIGLSYAIELTDIFAIKVNEPLVTGVFREHPKGSGKLVLAYSRVVAEDN